MLETSTNGAGPADEAVAGREDQRGVAERGFVAELGFVAGERADREGVPDPELAEQAKRRKFTAKYKLGDPVRGPRPRASPNRGTRP
jgi:hypothetical protein